MQAKNLLTLLALSSMLWAADDTNSTKDGSLFSIDTSLFFSREDGRFDVSDYLSQKYGFLPTPIIITEPAIGYGGGLNVMFLHDTLASSAKRKSPPSITGVALAATENGTKFGGAYHLGFWKEDSIRSTTAVGKVNVNIDFYLRDLPVAMNLDGYAAYQELMFRLYESNFFIGANYLYVDLNNKVTNEEIPAGIRPLFEYELNMAALSLVAQYDSRDTIFTPSKGTFAKIALRRFDERFGGHENYWHTDTKLFHFTPLLDTLVLGLRAEGEFVHASSGDSIPYVAKPFIDMRGITAMRYQGEKVLLGEAQLRWEFIPRWDLVFFGGVGKAYGGEDYRFIPGEGLVSDTISFSEADAHAAGGVGFRYELARKYGLWAGMDFATNEDREFSFYITVGSAWGAF